MSKLVTVLLSVYENDNPTHLRLSLDSLVNQSHQDKIILIGVDGDINEKLKKVLFEYKNNSRVLINYFDECRGLTAVLNDLIKISSEYNPAYIARMDADDIAKLDRFEKQINFLEENPLVDVVGGAIEEINFFGKKKGKIIKYPLTHKDCNRLFSYRNPLAHPAVMFRPTFFLKAGTYRASFKKNQDTALWYDGFMKGCIFANIPDVVLLFRVSDDMYKRRGGYKFVKEVLKLRLEINKGLKYGLKADILGYCYFIMAISPKFIKKIAYKLLR